jgi:hypothetical protein
VARRDTSNNGSRLGFGDLLGAGDQFQRSTIELLAGHDSEPGVRQFVSQRDPVREVPERLGDARIHRWLTMQHQPPDGEHEIREALPQPVRRLRWA